MVLEKTLESPLDCKEIQPVHTEGDQPWDFFGRKAVIDLDSLVKTKDITLPTKVHVVKAIAFPVVTYGCENWIPQRSLSSKEVMLSNCGAEEDTQESLGLQGDQTSPS